MTDYKKMDQPILFFDGVCNLCNSAVQFVMRHDPQMKILFSSLQSAAGTQLKSDYFAANGRPLPDSLVLFYRGAYHVKSAAVIQAAICLGGWIRLCGRIAAIFPRFLRDLIYDFIAATRYRWFGQKKECYLPNLQGFKGRFLI